MCLLAVYSLILRRRVGRGRCVVKTLAVASARGSKSRAGLGGALLLVGLALYCVTPLWLQSSRGSSSWSHTRVSSGLSRWRVEHGGRENSPDVRRGSPENQAGFGLAKLGFGCSRRSSMWRSRVSRPTANPVHRQARWRDPLAAAGRHPTTMVESNSMCRRVLVVQTSDWLTARPMSQGGGAYMWRTGTRWPGPVPRRWEDGLVAARAERRHETAADSFHARSRVRRRALASRSMVG